MLFQNVVFGPIHSRRLGTSLGINLLPSDYKVCNFDCIYCECGFNTRDLSQNPTFVSIHDVVTSLETFASCTGKSDLKKINSITFSGNGEPSLHPDFSQICNLVSIFRAQYMPAAKISLLTNATQIGKLEMQKAIRHIDNLILKLDAGTSQQYKLINRPVSLSFEKLVESLTRFGGDSIIQTLLLRSTDPQCPMDNTKSEEFASYLKIIKMIKPKQVMLYGIDRATPETNLVKLGIEELDTYADQLRYLGFKTDVY